MPRCIAQILKTKPEKPSNKKEHYFLTFALVQSVHRVSGTATYILDKNANNETSGRGREKTGKEHTRNSEKERSQDGACLPWHRPLLFGNTVTTLMNVSAARQLPQWLLPSHQKLVWRYFKRIYFENSLYGNVLSKSSKSQRQTWSRGSMGRLNSGPQEEKRQFYSLKMPNERQQGIKYSSVQGTRRVRTQKAEVCRGWCNLTVVHEFLWEN